MKDTYKSYIEDCIEILIERAESANKLASKTKNDFDSGVSTGYSEILSFLINQAEIFEIKDQFKERIKTYIP